MKKTRFNNLAISYLSAIILIGGTFTSACNTASPPRAIDGPANSASAQLAQKEAPPRDQQEINTASKVQITKLGGGTFKLSDYRGKVLLVDFWATDCAPCVRLVPQLAELSRKYRDQGLEVIGLTSDEQENEQQVVDFLKKRGADYTVGYDNRWLSSAFLKGTEDEVGPPIPQLFVISRDGRVVEHMIGENPQRVKALDQIISQQLAAR
jgi:thiol-disulfide isomerase/thioredoxin